MHVAVRNAQESRSATQLMRDVLRDGDPIAAEYPLVFGADAPGSLVVVQEEEHVRSTCAVLVREMVVGPLRFRAGLIGSVATDPEHRGRGYASRALAAAEEELRREDCVLGVLWADDPTFYLGRGWFPIGAEFDLVVPFDPVAARTLQIGVRPAVEEDLPALRALHATHPRRVERTAGEFERLFSVPGMQVLVREVDGLPVAYSCLGRGNDLCGVVHEWAGEVDDLLALFAGHFNIMATRDETYDLVVMTPPGPCALRDALEDLEAPNALGVLGMGKLASVSSAARLFDEIFLLDGAPGSASPVMDPQGVRVQGPGGSLVLDAEEALLCLLAPRGERGPTDSLEARTGLELPSLPLQPFVWGLDSI